MILDATCKDCGAAFQWERFAAAGRPRTRCDACRDTPTYLRKVLTGEPFIVDGVLPVSKCPSCGVQSAKGHQYCEACKPLPGRKVRLGAAAYGALLESQSGRCAICGKPPGARRLSIDHNHVTGRVRGLLCLQCNVGLGMFLESLRLMSAASDYLRKWNE